MQNHLEMSSKSKFWITWLFPWHFFLKNRRCWPPDKVFWWKNRVLQVSGRNTLENAIKITSKNKFSTHFVQFLFHLHPARQGAHPALSNSLLCQRLTCHHPEVSDCNLRQGARHLKGTYEGEFLMYIFGFFRPIWALVGPYGPGPGPWRAGKV